MKCCQIICVLFFICIFVSCSTREERQVQSLKDFTNELKLKSNQYTLEEWEQSIEEYEQIIYSLEGGKFTDVERKEIGNLKGQCIAIYSGYAIENFEQEIRGATEELDGFINGFLEMLEN